MHLKFVVSQSKIMTLTFKNSYNPVKPIILGTPQTLSIQQKFRFEMSEIPRSQWRVHSGCTVPTQATARLVIVLVSKIQKSGTGNNNFVKWNGTFQSDRPK